MHTPEREWDDLQKEISAACGQSPRVAPASTVYELNQLFRRFRQYEGEGDWVRLVIEGVAPYARQAAVFAVNNDVLTLRGQVNLDLPEGLVIYLNQTAACQAAVLSKEPVTAMRTSGEVGDALSAQDELALLLPILNGERVAALLVASDDEQAELNGLELICGMASSALERQGNTALHAQIGIAPSSPKEQHAAVAEPARSLPAWAGLAEPDRQLHSRASRFARVAVAEMELAKPNACRAARQQGNLYVLLGKEIDKARETYRKQFMTIPSMVDYFHRELVATALAGDAKKLGMDYPGELV